MPEAQITTRVYTIDELMEMRKKALEEEEGSIEAWNSLDDDQKIAVQDIVIQMLKTMIREPNWIPSGVKLDQGFVIDVNFRLLFSEITEEQLHRRAEEVRQIEEVRSDASRLLEELGGEGGKRITA